MSYDALCERPLEIALVRGQRNPGHACNALHPCGLHCASDSRDFEGTAPLAETETRLRWEAGRYVPFHVVAQRVTNTGYDVSSPVTSRASSRVWISSMRR